MPRTRNTSQFQSDNEEDVAIQLSPFFLNRKVLYTNKPPQQSLICIVTGFTQCKRFATANVVGVSVDGAELRCAEYTTQIPIAALEKCFIAYSRVHEVVLQGKSNPEGYLDFLVYAYRKGSQQKQQEIDAKKKLSHAERHLKKMQENYDKVFTNNEGPTFEKSATVRLQNATGKLEEKQAKLASALDTHGLLRFASSDSCVKYLKDKYDIHISIRTLYRRIHGKGKKAVGGVPALPPELETNLMTTALEYDKMGFAVTQNFVLQLANATRRDKRATPLGDGWYKAWFNRCKRENPELVHAFTSKLKTAVFDSYNSTSINWWYDMVKHSLINDLKVAKEVSAETSGTTREMDWLYPNRVLIFDETSLYGQKDIESRTGYKVITEQGRVDCGGRARRTDVKAPSGHVTFIAGHSLTLSTMPLVAILSRKVTDSLRNEIRAALKGKVGSDKFGPANGHLYHELVLGESAEGSVTKENIKQVILDGVVKIMFPDASDEEPAKRVIIFIDWHGSRLSADFLSACRARGVYIHCWLPNCTPTMQSPDIVLFGKFKSVFKSLTRKALKKLNMVDLISIGVDALSKVSTNANYNEGLKRSGMFPFTRQTHFELNKQIIQIGDERAKLKMREIHTSRLDTMHLSACSVLERSPQPPVFVPSPTNREINVMSPIQSSAVSAVDSIDILEEARDAAISTVAQRVQKRGATIGPNNAFQFTAKTPDEILKKANELSGTGRSMKLLYEQKLPVWVENIEVAYTGAVTAAGKAKQDALAAAEKANQDALAVAEKAKQLSLAKLKSDELAIEHAILNADKAAMAFQENSLASDADIVFHRQNLTNASEVLDALKYASRDEIGGASVVNYQTRIDLLHVPHEGFTSSPLKRKLDDLTPRAPSQRRNREMAASSVNQRVGPRLVNDVLIDELRQREGNAVEMTIQKEARRAASAVKRQKLEGKVLRWLQYGPSVELGVAEKRAWLRHRAKKASGDLKVQLEKVAKLAVHGGNFHEEFQALAKSQLRHYLEEQQTQVLPD